MPLRIGLLACCAVAFGHPAEVMAQTADHPAANRAFSTAMTCGELLALVHAGERQTVGAALLWLDGVHAGQAGLTDFPPGWTRTLARAVTGTCAMDINAARPVLEVVAEVHQRAMRPPPPAAK